ncbi:hypothetical protein I4F81_008322 [Pyropia yezoensis]|uniref:Uncharacterized protein n=1 Tax=Pyropia yezoensis TaxID=2788 RepID=A0ACC3C6N7_PYRYE|nr:hypothetical protein I4F81_008322 [Neopyropia yezoensis]
MTRWRWGVAVAVGGGGGGGGAGWGGGRLPGGRPASGTGLMTQATAATAGTAAGGNGWLARQRRLAEGASVRPPLLSCAIAAAGAVPAPERPPRGVAAGRPVVRRGATATHSGPL